MFIFDNKLSTIPTSIPTKTIMRLFWSSKTPFQKTLIVTLIVVIEIFLALVTLYILYGYVWLEPEQCPCATKFAPPPAAHRRAPKYQQPYNAAVASMLEVLQDGTFIYKCPAAIVAQNWALATTKCLNGGVSKLRLYSDFWSRDGVLFYLDSGDIEYTGHRTPAGYNKLALVWIPKIDAVSLKIGRFDLNQRVRVFAWDVSLEEKEEDERLAIFDVGPVPGKACGKVADPVSCYFTRNKKTCGKELNGPMLNEDDSLIGFHLTTHCVKSSDFAIVYFIKIDAYKRWVNSYFNVTSPSPKF